MLSEEKLKEEVESCLSHGPCNTLHVSVLASQTALAEFSLTELLPSHCLLQPCKLLAFQSVKYTAFDRTTRSQRGEGTCCHPNNKLDVIPGPGAKGPSLLEAPVSTSC